MAEGTPTRYVRKLKIKRRIERHAGNEHVMRPYQEADDGDRDADDSATNLYPNMRLRENARDDLADYTHRRQNHDVNRRVRIEPEQMLEQQRIAAELRIEDAEVKQAARQQPG